jgi:NitT/TauT family transport system permease protein
MERIGSEKARPGVPSGGWPWGTRRPWRALASLGPIATLVAAWELASRLGWVNPVLMPPPSLVFLSMVRYLGPGGDYLLWKHIALSLYRLLAGFVIAAAAAVPFGTAVGLFRPVYRFFTPILSIILPIPSIAWVPIVILWLGLGNATPIFIVFITAIFPIIYNVSTGVRSIDHKHVWAAQIMGANTHQIFLGVMLPGSLAYILTGLKLGMAGGWRALVAAEMLSATAYGLGYMIFEARTFLQVEIMYAGIMWLAVLGFLLENILFGNLEAKTLRRWGMLKDLR